MSWEPDTFELAYHSGPYRVAGYTYRGLGLYMIAEASLKGRRPPRWSLIHLGSGHRVCILKGTVASNRP